jgi:hypothetical protein
LSRLSAFFALRHPQGRRLLVLSYSILARLPPIFYTWDFPSAAISEINFWRYRLGLPHRFLLALASDFADAVAGDYGESQKKYDCLIGFLSRSAIVLSADFGTELGIASSAFQILL